MPNINVTKDMHEMEKIEAKLVAYQKAEPVRLDIKIQDIDDLYESYDYNHTSLNHGMIENCEEEAGRKSHEFFFHHLGEISEADIKTFEAAHVDYYNKRIARAIHKKKINTYKGLIFLLIGVALLAAGILLHQNELISEVIMIAAWFFVWEFVDVFFLQKTAINLEAMGLMALRDAKMTFIKEKSTKK